MRGHSAGTDLREQAMAALHESTTTLQVARKLLDQGNVEEANRLRDEARAQRNVSVWLMAKANTLDQELRKPGQPHPAYHHHSLSSTAH